MKPLAALCLVAVLCMQSALAQKQDSVSQAQIKSALDSLNDFFAATDTADLISLIDKMLAADSISEKSMMTARIGYNSNIISDARTLNIDKFGLSPGISYYHKSGAYADFTTYWSQQYDPNFYLSIASVGYIHSFGKKYSLVAEYSHYFYNLPSDSSLYVPYTNNVGLTNYLELKWLVLRLDYYLYFGDRSAHRIMPGVGLNLVRKHWMGIDRIAFYPSANLLYGTEESTTYEVAPDLVARLIYNQTHTDKLPLYYELTRTQFGLMNYSFTAPISLTKRNWNLMLAYTYNIPVSLPSEAVTLQNSGYLSFTITRYIHFK